MTRIQEDSSGNPYIEVPTLRDEHVRLTWVGGQKAGYHTDSIGFRIRRADGHLLMGPEVPLASISGLVQALFDLTMQCRK